MKTTTPKIRIRALLIIGAFTVAYLLYELYQEKFEFWNSLITDRLLIFSTRLKTASTLNDNLIIHVDANLNAYRSQHAQVIRNLSSMDIAALVFGTIFSERVGDEEEVALARRATCPHCSTTPRSASSTHSSSCEDSGGRAPAPTPSIPPCGRAACRHSYGI